MGGASSVWQMKQLAMVSPPFERIAIGSLSRSFGPPRLRRPVAVVHRLVWRRRPHVPAGGAPHRRPLPGCPRRLRRQHRHHAPGHLRHYQGTRVGGSRIALQGSWGTRLVERMGASVGETPAPGRRPHRRPASPSWPRLQNGRAGRPAREV